jgi:hypothetical protein
VLSRTRHTRPQKHMVGAGTTPESSSRKLNALRNLPLVPEALEYHGPLFQHIRNVPKPRATHPGSVYSLMRWENVRLETRRGKIAQLLLNEDVPCLVGRGLKISPEIQDGHPWLTDTYSVRPNWRYLYCIKVWPPDTSVSTCAWSRLQPMDRLEIHSVGDRIGSTRLPGDFRATRLTARADFEPESMDHHLRRV